MNEKTSFAIIITILVCAAAAAAFLGYALFPSPRETRFQAAAVSEDGTGRIIEFTLRSRPGNGALLVNVANAKWKENTATSFLAAREHVQRVFNLPLDNRDYEISVSTTSVGIEGESAGAAFATAIAANYLNSELRNDAVISAALPLEAANETLLPVGGIDEKILAAAKAGKRVFVVAESQQIKFENDLKQKIQVKRVRTLREAVKFLLNR